MPFNDYVKIARPNHWFKNIFVLPGFIVALLLYRDFRIEQLFFLIVGLISISLIASANYTINEWLDAESDKHHPVKKNRPSVVGMISFKGVVVQYAVLALLGLGLGATVSWNFFFTVSFLLFMGIIYNVKPLRSKDRLYLDVLSESVNNPIRFMAGWLIISNTIPPSSLLFAYWMAGAFLMATKRYAEYRFIGDKEKACLYRRSFRFYDENNLLVSILFYAMNFAFFFSIFLIKHRIEMILCLPFFSLLFCWYLKMGMRENSPAQKPEALYKEKLFVAFNVFLIVLIFFLLYLRLPALKFFLE